MASLYQHSPCHGGLKPHHSSSARSMLTSRKTYICITEAHGARLPLAQEQELVVSIDIWDAPVLLVTAAHLAGIICFCNLEYCWLEEILKIIDSNCSPNTATK